jgi:hypothetical protein
MRRECRKKAQKAHERIGCAPFALLVHSSGHSGSRQRVKLIGTIAPSAQLWLNRFAMPILFVPLLCAP